MDVYVLGAQVESLGEAIALESAERGHNVWTFGISGHEDQPIEAFYNCGASNVVCTIGINEPFDIGQPYPLDDTFERSMEVNVKIPMGLFFNWLKTPILGGGDGQFVFISSNSAHIARSGSLSYCVSKAALSMAMRVAARDMAKDRERFGGRYTYCYEPCWIEGTPMSQEVEDRLSGNLAHRVPGGKGLSRLGLAEIIVSNLRSAKSLHGASLRIDLGDQ